MHRYREKQVETQSNPEDRKRHPLLLRSQIKHQNLCLKPSHIPNLHPLPDLSSSNEQPITLAQLGIPVDEDLCSLGQG